MGGFSINRDVDSVHAGVGDDGEVGAIRVFVEGRVVLDVQGENMAGRDGNDPDGMGKGEGFGGGDADPEAGIAAGAL